MNEEEKRDKAELTLTQEKIKTERLSQKRHIVDQMEEIRLAFGDTMFESAGHIPGTEQKLVPLFGEPARKLMEAKYIKLMNQL